MKHKRTADTFPKRLTRAREARGWSKTELSFRSKTALSDISRFESGRMVPYPPTLARIAKTLGVELSSLTGEEDKDGAA